MSSPEIEAPEDFFTWADSHMNLEKGTIPFDKRNYRLDRMRFLLGLFGDPDRSYGIVHVAGTKGKGSTSTFLASVLAASGRKVGLFTKPHVFTPLERITVDGAMPDPGPFVETGRRIREVVESTPAGRLPGGFPPTAFELYTVIGLLFFRDAGCDTAVVETGIGGRLDATNVVFPEASVITVLDLEHTEVLGDTLEKIASEKAGIIKDGVPVYVARQEPEAREVFRTRALLTGSPVHFLDGETETLAVEPTLRGSDVHLRFHGDPMALDFRLRLLGAFQAENAALACLCLRDRFPGIPREAYLDGLAKADLPGRMELFAGTPPVILDGGHTPLAVRRLLESWRTFFPGEAVLLFGSVAGKNPTEMARILAPGFSRIVVSTPGTYKQSRPREVYDIFRALNPDTELEEDPARALARARELADGVRPILVTGSFYMVAEIRKLLAR